MVFLNKQPPGASYPIFCYNGRMKRLWAPWRMKFVETNLPGCVFCEALKQPIGPNSLVIAHARDCFLILNRYPYTSGHFLVVANQHVASLEDLEADMRAEMMEMVNRGMAVIRRVYHPEAFNVGANIGAAAGAGIAGHVHMHVVPRWTGDTNFMLTLAETKVMPEELPETYRRVRQEWDKA